MPDENKRSNDMRGKPTKTSRLYSRIGAARSLLLLAEEDLRSQRQKRRGEGHDEVAKRATTEGTYAKAEARGYSSKTGRHAGPAHSTGDRDGLASRTLASPPGAVKSWGLHVAGGRPDGTACRFNRGHCRGLCADV